MPLISKVAKGQVITAEKMNTIIDALNELRVTSVVGGQFSRGLGGTTITVPKSRGGGTQIAEDDFPFKISFPTATGCQFQAGTINGLLPSNYNDVLTLPAVTPTYVKYIVVKGTTSGKNITTAEIAVESASPSIGTALNSAPTTYSCLIYVIATGVAYRTIGKSSILAMPQELMRTPKAPSTAVELPYDSTYQWLFAS